MTRVLRGAGGVIAVLAILAGGVATAAQAANVDPVFELKNFSKTTERFRYVEAAPAFQLSLRAQGVLNELDLVQILATDPPPLGRNPLGNLCAHVQDACEGDPRLYAWANGDGVVKPVLFTARNGSTLSGHLWATKSGPAKRPGVVITNGSVQAPEEIYWFAAETLAKAGYVVMTWDPQGQGYSDTTGEPGADFLDGVPSQTGEPFYDGTEDALDFFFSDSAHPYVPRPSCSTGTSHAAKQASRVAAGKSSAFNPMSGLLDTTHVGLVGHSLGAGAVSYIGQIDPRVKAIVAYDNLSAGGTAAPVTCKSGSAPRPAPVIAKPALGMSADYGLLPEPNTQVPDPLGKSRGSLAMTNANVDTGELVIRGGTHYEFSFIPDPVFGGTLRGIDMVAWYTTAWLDKYLKGDPTADARLITNRWRTDAQEAAVDPDHDGNLYSQYYRSRLDIHLDGGARFTCEDVRATCPLAPDGAPGGYSYLGAALTPDGTGPAAALLGGQSTTRPAGALGVPPAGLPPAAPAPLVNIYIPGLLSLRISL